MLLGNTIEHHHIIEVTDLIYVELVAVSPLQKSLNILPGLPLSPQDPLHKIDLVKGLPVVVSFFEALRDFRIATCQRPQHEVACPSLELQVELPHLLCLLPGPISTVTALSRSLHARVPVTEEQLRTMAELTQRRIRVRLLSMLHHGH